MATKRIKYPKPKTLGEQFGIEAIKEANKRRRRMGLPPVKYK